MHTREKAREFDFMNTTHQTNALKRYKLTKNMEKLPIIPDNKEIIYTQVKWGKINTL